MSSKSCHTDVALIVGGVERGAGKDTHHSCCLVSGSVMTVFVLAV